jgi:hypothetical protein
MGGGKILSLSDYRKRKNMTVDERIKELCEYYDNEIDNLHTVIADLMLRLAILEEKCEKEIKK